MITIKQFAAKAGSTNVLKFEGFLYAPLKHSVNGAARVHCSLIEEDPRITSDGAYLVGNACVEFEGTTGNSYNNLVVWKDWFLATNVNRRAMNVDPELLNNVAMARATETEYAAHTYFRGVFIDRDRVVATNGRLLNKAATPLQGEEPYIMSGVIAGLAGKKTFLARVGNNTTLVIKEGIEYIDTDINSVYPDYRKLYENCGNLFENSSVAFPETKIANKQLMVFNRALGFEQSIYNMDKGHAKIKPSLLSKGNGTITSDCGAMSGAYYNKRVADCNLVRFDASDKWAQKPYAFENKDFTNYTLIMGLKVDQLITD